MQIYGSFIATNINTTVCKYLFYLQFLRTIRCQAEGRERSRTLSTSVSGSYISLHNVAIAYMFASYYREELLKEDLLVC